MSIPGSTPAKRRRTARSRRPARAAPPAAPAYLTRRIPCYALLDEEGLAAIEHHADVILRDFGVEFRGDPGALALFHDAGADVNGERVHFEPGLIRDIVTRTTPRIFTHRARNPTRSVEVGGEHTVFVPAYGSPFIRDLEKGRRYATIEDFRNLVKLAYLSPHLHYSGGTICEPTDLPVNKRHLDMVYAHMRWSDKPFLGSITSVKRARDSIDLCRVLFGADVVDSHCVILGNVNVNSPLVFDGTVSQVIRTYAAAGQGVVICPFILGGAMGPVTPAACIAQAHAEAMVGVALTQLERPGAPAVYGNFLTTMSLRSGAPTFGQPEAALAYMAVGQLARRCGVPLRCGGSFTASKVCDAQAAQESADALMPALMAGTNFVLHAAGWLEGGLTVGLEKLILDADRLGMMARLLEGLSLDENGFAMEAYRETGFGQHFLGAAHTLSNAHGAFYESAVADSSSFEQWELDGAKTAEQRACEIWQKQLKLYESPPMDEATDEALQSFIEKRKAGMPDGWY